MIGSDPDRDSVEVPVDAGVTMEDIAGGANAAQDSGDPERGLPDTYSVFDPPENPTGLSRFVWWLTVLFLLIWYMLT